MGPFERAKLRFIVAERSRRDAYAAGAVKYHVAADHLHGTQLEAHLIQDARGRPHRYRALFCGRRWGKTTLVQNEGLEECTRNPGCASVYIGPTINLAVKTVWDELVSWSASYGGVPNIANHWVKFPNGSAFYVLGAETKKTIDRVRGIKKIRYLAWDEQSLYSDELATYAIGSVITPALADVKGRLVLLGTGGPPRGYWHRVVTDAELGYAVFKRTVWDNPNILDPDEEVDRACKQRGVSRSDPYIRREWGSRDVGIEFTTDSERSVFPRIQSSVLSLPSGCRYVLGADVGSVDKTAVSVYALHENMPRIAMVESEKRKTLGSSDQIAFIREYALKYSLISSREVFTAVDPGGGGKAVIEDLRRLGGFGEILAAEKISKASNCRLMADDVRTGFLVVGPGNDAATAGLEALEWEPGKEGEKLRGHADDGADGALYGWRLAKKLYAYHEAPAVGHVSSDLQRWMDQKEAEDRAVADLGFS